ncbi:MAG: helix-turn-helix domain-containing protein [Vicinamibacterales bacterium]
MAHTSRNGQSRPGAIASQQQVVERAEAYMRAHTVCRVPLSRLCQIVGLSERGLRNAFYGVRGMSPKRSILAERLRDVRSALSHSDTTETTVASIATEYGFYELGRFAATYKEAFGEAPSDTLRGTSRRAAPHQNVQYERHANACTS